MSTITLNITYKSFLCCICNNITNICYNFREVIEILVYHHCFKQNCLKYYTSNTPRVFHVETIRTVSKLNIGRIETTQTTRLGS